MMLTLNKQKQVPRKKKTFGLFVDSFIYYCQKAEFLCCLLLLMNGWIIYNDINYCFTSFLTITQKS